MLLVDGNNVMGARPDGWWRDRRGAMERLVQALEAHAANNGLEVVVVFDGGQRRLATATGAVAVRFAPHADDLLAALAHAGDTVVTSDRELAARVRACGATVRGAGAFRASLEAPHC